MYTSWNEQSTGLHSLLQGDLFEGWANPSQSIHVSRYNTLFYENNFISTLSLKYSHIKNNIQGVSKKIVPLEKRSLFAFPIPLAQFLQIHLYSCVPKIFEKASLFLEIQTFNFRNMKIWMNNENATDVTVWTNTDVRVMAGVRWINIVRYCYYVILAF